MTGLLSCRSVSEDVLINTYYSQSCGVPLCFVEQMDHAGVPDAAAATDVAQTETAHDRIMFPVSCSAINDFCVFPG